MPLDLAILDARGAPSQSVAIGVDTHSDFVAAARRNGLPMVEVLADYYKDATFSLSQLDALRSEIEILRQANTSPEVQALLSAIDDLISEAKQQGTGIHVISD